MRAHAKLTCAAIGAHPPKQYGKRQKEACDDPPAALIERRDAQAIFRRWRFQRQPEKLTDEFAHVPIHRSQHGKPDDLKGNEAKEQREQAKIAKINRTYLRITKATKKVHLARCAIARRVIGGKGHTRIGYWSAHLYPGEDVLIFGHGIFPSPRLAPNRQVKPPAPPFGPAARPERTTNHDADRTPNPS